MPSGMGWNGWLVEMGVLLAAEKKEVWKDGMGCLGPEEGVPSRG